VIPTLPTPAARVVGSIVRLGWRVRAAVGLGPRVLGGQGLRLHKRLRISGRGTVVLGRDLEVRTGSRLLPAHPDARIEVGSGMRFRNVTITGPGTVRMGDGVRMSQPKISTQNTDAVVTIGERTLVGRSVMDCSLSITIGRMGLIAGGILDADYHHTSKRRRRGERPPPRPVRIGDNVWVAPESVILKGVTVGDNSVIGLGAIVSRDVPADRIWAGNPAKDVGPVPD
jgi:acetyltransferase-like isoleucine patch superfamily enzyme